MHTWSVSPMRSAQSMHSSGSRRMVHAASVVLMPILLYVYIPSLGETEMQLPYLAVMGTLALMLLPITSVADQTRSRMPS